MFGEIHDRYDLMNRVLTLRFDEKWRKIAALECMNGQSWKVVDLCCGTGDLAIHMAKLAKGKGQVTGIDFSRPMLGLARAKAEDAGLERISFIEADAAALPIEDNRLDAIGISFGFRNLTYRNPDRDQFLSEIHRTLKPSGKLVFVETSQPENRLLRWFFHLYLDLFVVGLGGRMSGHRQAYRYLGKSARNYFDRSGLVELLQEAGFGIITHRPLFGGIAAMTVAGKKIKKSV